MLKPSQINPIKPDPIADVTRLHEQFDQAIQHAADKGTWPAVVPNMCDGMPIETINSVCEEYRAAGWIVGSAALRSDVRATIDHPDRILRTAPAGPEYQCGVCSARGQHWYPCPFEHYPQGHFVRPIGGKD